MRLPKALRTKTLPQYLDSEDVMARFLEAAHGPVATEIADTPYSPGERSVRTSELERDGLDHFLGQQANSRNEFGQELEALIGVERARQFCGILSEAWYDSGKRRKGDEVAPIRASIEGYLYRICGRPLTEDASRALVDPAELVAILSLTWRLLETAVEDWLEKHGRDGYASGNVFFRRGLVLPDLFKDDHAYAELSVLSSYTLSVTLAEQFANTDRKDNKSALVHADFYLMRGRVLFFSPFVPGMRSFQLEAGVIPAERSQRLSFMGVHRGVGEYLLDYPEEVLDDLE